MRSLVPVLPFLFRYRVALNGIEESAGARHPEASFVAQNLGLLLQEQGDLAGAQPHLERARDNLAFVQGEDHPDTLEAVLNLGELYVRT